MPWRTLKSEAKTGGKDCLSLPFDVNKEMGKVSEIIKSRGNVNMGTVTWRTVAGATTKTGERGWCRFGIA